MNLKKVAAFLAIVLVFFLFAYFLSSLEITGNAVLEREKANLTRAVDGDTIETSLGTIRLLGINNKRI
jgi:endonuclease YncB( thermonuclease family)